MEDTTRKQFDLDLTHQTPRIHPRKKEEPPQKNLMWFYVGASGQIGFSILVPLLIGVFVGVWIDSKYGTKPLWTIIGLGGGFIVSLISLVKTVKDLLKHTHI